MADIVVSTDQGLPSSIQLKYRDMGDGTHAPAREFRNTVSGGNDIVLSLGQSQPATMRVRYADRGDGTHAQVIAR